MRWAAVCLCAQLAVVQMASAQDTAADGNDGRGNGRAVSESDYLQDVPTVLSVSRLSQPLADVPGALTILDRDFIRMTGARHVVDVLRFVPGFQTTTSFETDAPMASYHGRNDDYSNRIQVLVDGRSVYSGLLQGSAGMGWQTLALDDIERIEVLRGSNSATYGARAFLGVVNIVSRDVQGTLGAAASITRGENDIEDAGFRLGWTAGDASFRLSADRVGDAGLQGAFGRNRTERFNLSSHWALDRGAELNLRAGSVTIHAGRGSLEAGESGNPARQRSLGSQFVQADWRAPLSDTQDLSISLSRTENSERDGFIFLAEFKLPVGGATVDFFGTTVDFGGIEYADTLTAQHTIRVSPTLRGAWGMEWRRENVVSRALFDQLGSVSSDFYRLFGSAEWRLNDTLLLNTGVLAEHSTIAGDSVSPRVMLNWHLLPGHTLRLGMSTAFRPPSAYEKFAQVQYYDPVGNRPSGYFTFNNGTLKSEKLSSHELGYHFAHPKRALGGDIRVFSEQISDGITSPMGAAITPTGVIPNVNLNGLNSRIEGVELQGQWNWSPQTRLMLTQAWTSIAVDASPGGKNARFRAQHGAPSYAASVTLMHRFAQGLQLSVMHQQTDDVALMSISSNPWLYSMQRTDLRLAQELKFGKTKAELGLVLQNLGDRYEDGDRKFFFQQKALLTLKIEH